MAFQIDQNHYFDKEKYVSLPEEHIEFKLYDILNDKQKQYVDVPIFITAGNKLIYSDPKIQKNINFSPLDNQINISILDTFKESSLVWIQVHNGKKSNINIENKANINLIHSEIMLGTHTDSFVKLNTISDLNYYNTIEGNEFKVLLHNQKEIYSHSVFNGYFMQKSISNPVKNDVEIFVLENANSNVYILNDIQDKQLRDDAFEIKHIGANTQSIASYLAINAGKAVSQINSIIEEQAIDSSLEQHLKHILTSENAQSQSKPSLIIHTPTVASHGNTIGSYPEEWLFYLYQKGLEEDTIKRIMRESYIKDFCSKTPFEESFIQYFLGENHE